MNKTLLLLIVVFLTSVSNAQVTLLKSNKSLRPYQTMDSTKAMMVSDKDSTLWVTDGTPIGTKQLSSKIKYIDGAGYITNKLFFVGKTDSTGTELYVTDGTSAGTKLVKDILPGVTSSSPADFAQMNGRIYFTCVSPNIGRELWKTDGTTAGTVLVKDIVVGAGSSNKEGDYNLFSNGSYLLFSAKSGTKGYELYKCDGTAAGTALLKNINTKTAGTTTADSSSNPGFFARFGNMVLFTANDGYHGNELWITDGTAANTRVVKDIRTGTAGSMNFAAFFKFNGKAFFIANDGTHGDEIWFTDGTTAGTGLLKDIFTGTQGSYATLYSAIPVGNKFFFSAFSITNGFEMWQSDGTPAGTTLFKDIVSGSNSSNPIILPAYKFDTATGELTHPLFQGNKFFFMATTPAKGTELWVSDGTVTGTKIVKDINPGAADGITSPSYFYTTTAFYFSAEDSSHGNELWKTNGTPTGTALVYDINPGTGSSDVEFGAVVNGKLVFMANNGDNVNQTDLYRVNATVVALREYKERPEIVLKQNTPALTVKLLGNPVRSGLKYQLDGVMDDANVYLKDMMGRAIRHTSFATGNGIKEINIENLAPGLYMLVVESGTERRVVRFIKQ